MALARKRRSLSVTNDHERVYSSHKLHSPKCGEATCKLKDPPTRVRTSLLRSMDDSTREQIRERKRRERMAKSITPAFSPYGPRPKRSPKFVFLWVACFLFILFATWYMNSRHGDTVKQYSGRVVKENMAAEDLD
ncbi:hypothetical protein B0H63DRAFT_558792 [Podospora didyma]|uniref:Transmembrane protein n=1 Tax=Podospora didyma TaxID=330526 RepID=A0AAE0U1C3_9PEZI|nr:hypothetical protein B0H63DRAFT_558792 [Podospora didyma]